MENVKPHWGWFLFGPGVLVLGCIGAILILIGGISSAGVGMQRVPIPGEAIFVVEDAGSKTLFFEVESGIQNDAPDGLKVEVRPVSGGELLMVEHGGMSSTYTINNVSGRSIGSVNFPAPGEYKVKTSVPPQTVTNGQVTVGGGSAGAIVGSVFGFMGIGFVSLLLCVFVLVVVGVMRSRFRKRAMQHKYAAHQQSGGPPAPPPGAMTS